MSTKNAKTLTIVRYHNNPAFSFLTKAGVESSPREAKVGILNRKATTDPWLFFPAMSIFGGLSSDQVDQILTRMRQP